MSDLIILYNDWKHPAWAPISHMARLGAALFDAPLLSPRTRTPGILQKLSYAVPRRRDPAKPNCLVIANHPGELHVLACHEGWRSAFNKVAAWIIDSFWIGFLPSSGIIKAYDHFFITHGNDVDKFEAATKVPTSALTWGADVLGLGGADAQKDIDLLRVGRQPASWNDDESNQKLFESAGVAYHGRPPTASDPAQHYRNVFDFYRRSKFVLTHTNLVDDSTHTHRTKEYVTARWTDALACGCVVIGVQPTTDYAMRAHFWPEATVNLSTPVRDEAVADVERAISRWSPDRAQRNYREALMRLDWRWRFREVAEALGISSEKLDRDLALIEQKAKTSGAA